MNTFCSIVLGLVVLAGSVSRVVAADFALTSQPAVPEVVLTSPMEWEVFQRSSATKGKVRIAGRVEGAGGKTMKLQAHTSWITQIGEQRELAMSQNETVDWTGKLKADGGFDFEVTMGAGAWNAVTLHAMVDGRPVGEKNVEHVGVGDVFVVGGQSNSTNWGEVKTKTETGMVTVFDGKGWTVAADPLPGVDGKGGSPWCAFGDALVGRLKVPVGIVPVGRGSTSVRQWLPKGDAVGIEPSRDYGLKKLGDGTWESEGVLFDRMVERMKQLGPNGFRAMLWHQGESDAHQTGGHTLPGVQYRAMLERVIKESRKEAGWEVPWFVATASWGSPETPADPDIRAAQQGVVTDGVAMAGPDTDTLLGENRQKNGTGVHMSAVGLKAHGELWAGIVGKWLEKAGKAE